MKRPKAHVIEDISKNIFKSLLPQEWIIREIPSDYGVDIEVEIVEDESVTGKRFWVQIKGTESVHIRDGYVAFVVDTKLLDYSLRCDFPLLLGVVDISGKEAYWLPLRDEIEKTLEPNNPHWREQGSVTVRIPLKNSLSEEKKRDYYGLIWYSMEPARMRAFCIMHYYYHELNYTFPWSIQAVSTSDLHPARIQKLVKGLRTTRSYLALTLSLDCLFGNKGLDLFVVTIKPVIEEGLEICDRLLREIPEGKTPFPQIGVSLGKTRAAVDYLSTCISMYQYLKEKFLFFESDFP